MNTQTNPDAIIIGAGIIDLGLTLEQISHILQNDISAEEIHGILRLRQAELEEQVQEKQEQLARVRAR